MSNDDEKKMSLDPVRLAWACRRGMLELDILLNQFLTKAYPQLTETDQRMFVELLKTEDAELYAWLLGQAQPDDENMLRMIRLVRDHVAHTR